MLGGGTGLIGGPQAGLWRRINISPAALHIRRRNVCCCRWWRWLPLSYAYSQAITSTSVLSTQEYPWSRREQTVTPPHSPPPSLLSPALSPPIPLVLRFDAVQQERAGGKGGDFISCWNCPGSARESRESAILTGLIHQLIRAEVPIWTDASAGDLFSLII